MNGPPDRDTWIGPEFLENRRAFPADELRKYAGQYVAFSWDGTRILMSDPDEPALYQKVLAVGLDVSRVVFSHIDTGEHSHL